MARNVVQDNISENAVALGALRTERKANHFGCFTRCGCGFGWSVDATRDRYAGTGNCDYG